MKSVFVTLGLVLVSIVIPENDPFWGWFELRLVCVTQASNLMLCIELKHFADMDHEIAMAEDRALQPDAVPSGDLKLKSVVLHKVATTLFHTSVMNCLIVVESIPPVTIRLSGTM